MRLGLALSIFLLRKASELRAYANGQVYPEFCLTRTRSCWTFFLGEVQVAFENLDRARGAAAVLGIQEQTDESGLHDHSYACGERNCRGSAGRRARLKPCSSCSMCIPSFPGRPCTNRQAHTCRPSSFYAHGSGGSVENTLVGGSGRDPAHCAPTGEESGGRRSWRPRGSHSCKSGGQGDGGRGR